MAVGGIYMYIRRVDVPIARFKIADRASNFNDNKLLTIKVSVL